RIERGLTDRHDPILVAFARPHRNYRQFLVDIAPLKTDQLAHPQATRVEGLDDRAVAKRLGTLLLRVELDKPPDVVTVHDRRQLARELGRTQRRGWTGRAGARLAVAKNRFHRRKPPLHGGALGATLHHIVEPRANIVRVNRPAIDLLARMSAGGRPIKKEFAEKSQVATVAVHGMP